MKIPPFFKKHFWDVDFNKLDFDKNLSFIIIRILEYGDPNSVRWLFKHTDKMKIKQTVLETRELSPRALNFWSIFLNLSRRKIKCLRKSYQKIQIAHWPH